MIRRLNFPFFLGCLIFGCVLVCVILGVALVWRTLVSENTYRAALPASAQNVQDTSVDLFPDWEYYLKADISPEEFDAYVQELGVPVCQAEDHIWIGWHTFSAPEWWDPTSDTGKTYCQNRNGDIWEMAKYENGHLYLRAYSH